MAYKTVDEITIEAYKYFKNNINDIDYIILDDGSVIPIDCGHNDDLDAFRHAYVSAVFTYGYGNKTAYLLGLGNEVNGWLDNQPSSERRMDLWNNRAGREIGVLRKE